MKSIILTLLYDKMFEQKCTQAPEQKERHEKLEKIADSLLNSLSPEQKKLFDSYVDVYSACWSFETDCAYECGFKIGGRLVSEMYHLDLDK